LSHANTAVHSRGKQQHQPASSQRQHDIQIGNSVSLVLRSRTRYHSRSCRRLSVPGKSRNEKSDAGRKK
jgi:hypothetical protein